MYKSLTFGCVLALIIHSLKFVITLDATFPQPLHNSP